MAFLPQALVEASQHYLFVPGGVTLLAYPPRPLPKAALSPALECQLLSTLPS